MTTVTATPAAVARPRGAAARLLHYFLGSLGTMLRDWSFMAFIIALPVTMYLFFTAIYGEQETAGGVKVAAVMMISMATYGGLGAAMNAGAVIQTERSSGWFRQLMLSPLTPAQFVVAKVATAICAVIPALLAVFAAGLLRGVRLTLGEWLATFGVLMGALLPMVMLGLVIGLWFKQQTATAVTTLAMLALAMVGGLWFPLEAMPTWMQAMGRLLPSYWAGQIGQWPLLGGDFPWRGVAVIGIWTVALLGLGALGYRRAVRTSRR